MKKMATERLKTWAKNDRKALSLKEGKTAKLDDARKVGATKMPQKQAGVKKMFRSICPNCGEIGVPFKGDDEEYRIIHKSKTCLLGECPVELKIFRDDLSKTPIPEVITFY